MEKKVSLPQSAHNALPNLGFDAADLLGNHDRIKNPQTLVPLSPTRRRLKDEDDCL